MHKAYSTMLLAWLYKLLSILEEKNSLKCWKISGVVFAFTDLHTHVEMCGILHPLNAFAVISSFFEKYMIFILIL